MATCWSRGGEGEWVKARSCWWIGLLVLTVSLAGCGVTSVAAAEQHTSTPMATPTPTATLAPAPTATSTPSSSVTMPCSPPPSSGIVTVGDLQATIGLGNFSYPSRKLPDGISLAPFKLQDS